MANLNIQIDLTKLPGARVMDIQGNTMTRRCVVIPIDETVGTVCESYKSKTPDGQTTTKFYNDVKLNIVAIEYNQKKHGISHGLKPAFSREYQERMTEDQMYNTPWMGTIKPWKVAGENPQQEDLPAADDNKYW